MLASASSSCVSDQLLTTIGRNSQYRTTDVPLHIPLCRTLPNICCNIRILVPVHGSSAALGATQETEGPAQLRV